jgi:C-terminal processing protease CtpA/Prc
MLGPQLPSKFNRGRFFDRTMLAQREIVPIVTGYDSRTRSWKEFDVPFEAVGDTYRKPLVLVVSAALGSAPENFCMDLKYTRRAAVVGVTRTSGYSGSVAFIHLPGGATLFFTGARCVDVDPKRASRAVMN